MDIWRVMKIADLPDTYVFAVTQNLDRYTVELSVTYCTRYENPYPDKTLCD